MDVEEFERVMMSINQKLSEEEVNIPSRPIMAVMSLAKILKINPPLAGPLLEPSNFPLTEMNAANHVYLWYERLYSDKLKIDPTQAKFPFLIHGDVYQVNIPLVFGQHIILSSQDKVGGDNVLNAVDMIDGLTDQLRRSLGSNDENKLQAFFVTCFEVSRIMRAIPENNFISSALKDSFVSCENLMMRPVSPDLSAWHSAQFVEKLLKFFISCNAGKVERTHKLKELVAVANELGYVCDTLIDWEILSSISPSFRYEPGQVKISEAVDINIEAWRAAFNILTQVVAP